MKFIRQDNSHITELSITNISVAMIYGTIKIYAIICFAGKNDFFEPDFYILFSTRRPDPLLSGERKKTELYPSGSKPVFLCIWGTEIRFCDGWIHHFELRDRADYRTIS